MKTLIALSQYKYAALAVLAVIEGPVTSLTSGFFIRLGYLEFLPVILILIAGDIVSDSLYYFLAIKGNGEKYVRKYGSKYKIISENFELLGNLWKRHGAITMFLGNFAYGFTIPLIVSSAISKVPYKKMLLYTIPPSVIKYSALMIIGYYLAYSYKEAEKYIYLSAIYIPLIYLSFFFGYKLILRYLQNKVKGDKK